MGWSWSRRAWVIGLVCLGCGERPLEPRDPTPGAVHFKVKTYIAAFMQACTEDKPTLVVGDFNEGIHGRAIEYLEDRGFRNALPLFRPGQHTWRHASVANQMTQTLDHILFDDSFDPLNAWVIDAGSSDHLPVVAHLEATSAWSTRTPIDERTAPRQ